MLEDYFSTNFLNAVVHSVIFGYILYSFVVAFTWVHNASMHVHKNVCRAPNLYNALYNLIYVRRSLFIFYQLTREFVQSI
jgi:hypothetical protein